MRKLLSLVLILCIYLSVFSVNVVYGEDVCGISITPAVSDVSEIPAGNKVKFTYSALDADGVLGENGGCVKMFNNGVQVGTSLTATEGSVDIVISDGTNTISAAIYSVSEEVIAQSTEYTVKGISLQTNATVPGYCLDYDEVYNNGEFKGTGTITSYSYDDPDQTRGEGKVAYRQYAASQTSHLIYQPGNINIYPQGRFVEISADIKSNAPTNQRNFNIINLSSYYPDPSAGMVNEKWGTGGILVLSTGKIACYDANGVTDIDADLNNWHNYKIIFDTNAEGTPRAYYFVDDVFVYYKASAHTNIRAIRQAQFGATYDGVNAIDLYLDNVTLRTYNEAFDASLDVGTYDLKEVPYENIQPKICFSLDMNAESMENILIKTADGDSVEFTGTYDHGAKVFTFDALNLKAYTKYIIDLSDVCTFAGAGGTKELSFITEKAPFSVRSVSEQGTKATITLNNKNNTQNSAVVIVGYYDSDTLYTFSAREITCTSDRQTFEFAIAKPQDDVWIEVYLLDSQNFGVIDKLIMSE